MKERPTPVRACLLDIEGVLVRDKRYDPVPGAVAWVERLVAEGIPFALVSNNTTHPPHRLVEALVAGGFPLEPEHLVTVLDVAVRLLQGWGKTRLFWLGTPELADWWSAQGFTLVDHGPADAVVVGLNERITVEDLDRALPALVDHGAELVALHRNPFFLDSRGERRFGPGFYVAGLATVAREEPVVVGKPHERIYREALRRIGAAAEGTLFVSDDPVADLVTAGRLGMTTAFVLSGKYSDHAVLGRLDQQEWPDIVAAALADVPLPGSGTGPGEGTGDQTS